MRVGRLALVVDEIVVPAGLWRVEEKENTFWEDCE